MLIEFLVNLVKDITLIILKVIFPFGSVSFSPIDFSFSPVFDILHSISAALAWLFDHYVYTFFVTTVLIVTFTIPAFHLLVFFIRLVYRFRSFF